MTPNRRAASATIATVIGVVILCALGYWQLQRLQWKQGLLADIAAKLERDAIAFTSVPQGNTAEFTKVTVSGNYLPASNRFMIAVFEGGGGWRVATPLLLANNSLLLVDRGTIPDAARPTFETESFAGPVTLTGILRLERDGPGQFTPDNDAAGNRWYWWDVPAMLASVNAPPEARIVPVVIQLLPAAGNGQLPRAQQPSANLTNNHLGYAITWFGFAVILAVIGLLFVRQQMKKPGA
jgi:surfeit locus 1 family protein